MTAQVSRLRHASRFGAVLVALVLAAMAATVAAARPAHANSGPSITAYGGPAQVRVTGNGFARWASVRVVVLTNPGLGSVGVGPVSTQADGNGDIGLNVTGMTYAGSVYVLVDSAPFPTVGAITTVQTPPQWISVGQEQCFYSYPVRASAYGFAQYYGVRFELLSQDLTKVLDTQSTRSDGMGDAYEQLSTSGYSGWAWVVADEIGGGPTGYIPLPYSLWAHVYVC